MKDPSRTLDLPAARPRTSARSCCSSRPSSCRGAGRRCDHDRLDRPSRRLGGGGDCIQPMSAERARSLVARRGAYPAPAAAPDVGGAHVVRLDHSMALGDVEAITRNLLSALAVLHAVADQLAARPAVGARDDCARTRRAPMSCTHRRSPASRMTADRSGARRGPGRRIALALALTSAEPGLDPRRSHPRAQSSSSRGRSSRRLLFRGGVEPALLRTRWGAREAGGDDGERRDELPVRRRAPRDPGAGAGRGARALARVRRLPRALRSTVPGAALHVF